MGKNTIRDVAILAGVSVATAGRVIGNYGHTSEKTKTKVKAAAKELNFVPNAIAQEMRKHSTKTIAVVVTNIRNNFFSQIVYEIEKYAREKEYNILIFNTREKPEIELQCLETLYTKQVEGIILASCFNNISMIPVESRYLYTSDIPIVTIDRKIEGLRTDEVQSEQIQGAYEATKYLLELGHRNISVIGIKTDEKNITTTVKDRIIGYQMALKEFGVFYNENRVHYLELEDTDLSEAFAPIFDKKCDTTAIILLNNLLCAPLLMEVKRRKLQIPDDYSLIDWDDDIYNELLDITTVEQQVKRIGNSAVKRVFQLIDKKTYDGERINITLETRLIIRGSCKKR